VLLLAFFESIICILLNFCSEEQKAMKKEKPLTKKERDEKRKKRKEKQKEKKA
jgi:hypothetical protein